MTPEQRVRADAIARHRPGDTLSVVTDARSKPDHVLVGLVCNGLACVMTIDKAEYDPYQFGALLGFDMTERPIQPTPPTQRHTLAGATN